jgi:hypothetical protein
MIPTELVNLFDIHHLGLEVIGETVASLAGWLAAGLCTALGLKWFDRCHKSAPPSRRRRQK